MTITQIIETMKQTKPHALKDEVILSYINTLELQAQVNVMQVSDADRVTYTWENDLDTPLLIDGAFESCYLFWVAAMIDMNQQELVSYNHNIGLFNALWDEYTKWYIRTHTAATPTRIKNIW